MKKRVYISFNLIPATKGPVIRPLVEAIGCADGWKEAGGFRVIPSFEYTYDADDERLAALRDLVRREGIDPFERIDLIYTNTELRRFPLLQIGVKRKPIESGGPEFGTTFDLSEACPRCGTGAVQTSPLMVALTELPKKGLILSTGEGHILIAEPVADAFREAGILGAELRQVHFYRNNEPLPWFQIISTYEMPKFGPATKNLGRDTDPGWGCPVCQRDMHCQLDKEPVELAYDRNEVDPDKLPDIVHTWECFGRSVLKDDPERHLIKGFATPLILVKPKVFDLLRKLKVRHADFAPVRVV